MNDFRSGVAGCSDSPAQSHQLRMVWQFEPKPVRDAVRLEPAILSDKVRPENAYGIRRSVPGRVLLDIRRYTGVVQDSRSDAMTVLTAPNAKDESLIHADHRFIGELLADGRKFSLPPYQRPFEWKTELTEQFLADVHAAQKHGENDYYIGAITLTKKVGESSVDEYEVVDGQQRLSTLLVILGNLRGKLRQHNAHVNVEDRLSGALLRHGKGSVASAVLSSPTSSLSQALLQMATGGLYSAVKSGKKKDSVSRLLHNYEETAKAVETWLSLNLASIHEMAGFATFLLDAVSVVEIIFPSNGKALHAFINQNSKSLTLAQADLIKSAFMREDASLVCEQFNEQWTALIDGGLAHKGGHDGFLRKAMMAAILPKIDEIEDAPKSTALLEALFDHQKKTPGCTAKSLFEVLSRFAQRQVLLRQKVPEYTEKVPARTVRRLQKLPTKPEFVHTLLAALPDGLIEDVYERVAKTLEGVACYVGLTGESKNINYAIQPFCVEARDVVDIADATKLCADIWAKLGAPLQADFESKVKLLQVTDKSDFQKRWATYLLLTVEEYLRDGLGIAPVDFSEAGPLMKERTVEHIIARHFLTAGTPPRLDTTVYSLGNCTLLEKAFNESLGKATVQEKVDTTYGASKWELTVQMSKLHVGKTTAKRVFLDRPEVAPLWDFGAAPWTDTEVEARLTAIVRCVKAYWAV